MRIERNALGRLRVVADDGTVHEPVTAVRAFPIEAPESHVSLVAPDGHEAHFIARLSELAPAERALVEEELHHREFIPVIERLVSVSSFATPSTWTVDTDRGRCKFVLKGEEDIRRLYDTVLLIADSHGVQFLIRDPQALDRRSRRFLDRFR